MVKQHEILNAVQQQYADVAKSALSNDSRGVQQVAQAFGYQAEELTSLPPDANMGLSCGNPTSLANLRTGETVVDLGCGGGIDVLLAARKVGPSGKAIGIDMTPEMLDRARANVAKAGVENVEFHQATIDTLPLPDASVDCIVSNCVINLVPDKAAAFREMMRVLKPGGRLAISDIALLQPLPDQVRESVGAYVGCIAGAVLVADYEAAVRNAGFDTVVVTNTGADLNAYAQAEGSCCCVPESEACCEPATETPAPNSLHDELADILGKFDVNAYAASVMVHAVKGSADLSTGIVKGDPRVIEIFDKPMCCSTGVCGPQVDPRLAQFAADLQWLEQQGVTVHRYNLAHEPHAFAGNQSVQDLLASDGVDCLPLVFVSGKAMTKAAYPSREMLGNWFNIAVQADTFPIVPPGSGCCGGSEC